MLSRLTKTGKFLVAFATVVVFSLLAYWLIPKFTNMNLGSKDPDLVIALNKWSGFAPILDWNGGKNADPVTNSYIQNDSSKVLKDFGLGLQINQMDDRKTCIEALLADKVDAIYVTTDVFSPEMPSAGELAKAGVVQWLKVDDSRGADVIVSIRSIQSVADFKKTTKIGCTFPTASSTLLLELLDAGGKTINDVTVIYFEAGDKVAEAFKTKDIDVGVVWSPDDGDCLKAIEGSHVLFSTKYATSIIMDGMLAKKSTIDKKFKSFVKLGKAWMAANASMQSETNRMKAAESFSKAFNFDLFLVQDGVNKVRFSTYGDNVAFFGLDPNYNGVTGDDLYTRMAKVYSKVPKNVGGGFWSENPVPWVKASYSGVIEAIKDLTGPENAAEGQITFAPSTKETLTKTAVATKQITIQFALNSADLDNVAKDIIDRQITGTLKGWLGARIRIEGNADNTGNYKSNKELSFKRALSVKNYLVRTYNFDPNRIDVIGNGCDKPANGSKDIKSANLTQEMRDQNRRTDFGLITE